MSAYGALGFARTLGRLAIPVYLICNAKLLPIAFSRYWRGTYPWDLSAPAERSLDFLADVGRRVGRGSRPLLFHTTDRAAVFVADHAGVLADRFVFPDVSPALVRALSNKWLMFQMAKDNGVPVPETIFPRCREDVERFLVGARFPLLLKGVDPLQPRGWIKQVVRDARGLLAHYDRAAADGSANLMLQEYIPGSDHTVWMCNAYFDRRSACLAACTGRKLRQFPPHAGVASLAICEPNEVVERTTAQFMKAVGYRGHLDIGFRFDARDGRYKVLDVNPRLGGAFRLFADRNGMDVVRAGYLDLTGQPVPPLLPAGGRKWMLEEDIFAALAYAREGALTVRLWVRSWRGVEETQWFAADDPLPGLVWCWLRLRPADRLRLALLMVMRTLLGKRLTRAIKTAFLKPRLS